MKVRTVKRTIPVTVVDQLTVNLETNEVERIIVSIPGVYRSEAALRKRIESNMDDGYALVKLSIIQVDHVLCEMPEEEFYSRATCVTE